MNARKNPKGSMIFALAIGMILFASVAFGTPVGPTITQLTYSSPATATGTVVDNSSHTGGVIATANFFVNQQDPHWKAYVGNVSGTLALRDAENFSIFSWTLGTVQGEVYSTRSSSVTWSTIICANESTVANEMVAMNHTTTYTPNDNISATFLTDTQDHTEFYAGSSHISQDSCDYSLNLYMNSTSQSAGSSDWEEVILYDTTNNGIIYTSIIEQDLYGYHNYTKYDYQILLPEKGEPSFTGATAYYFYVELL